MNDLVSIVMPTYKGAQFIKRSVDSLLKQDYNNIEVIIVDDNGVDTEEQKATYKILKEYIEKNLIKYICNKINVNGSYSRNVGLKYCNGDYVCFLDDDDCFDETKVSKQINCFEKNKEIGLVFTGVKEIYDNGKIVEHNIPEYSDFLKEYLMCQLFVCSSSIMVKKSIIDQIKGWDESFYRHQDMEFIVRIASITNVYPLNECLVYKYRIDRNLPTNANKVNEYRRHYLKKMHIYIEKFDKKTQKNIIFYNLLPIGKAYIKNNKIIKSLKIAFESKKFFKMLIFYIKDGVKSKKRREKNV